MKLSPWITVPILCGLIGAAVYIPEIETAKDFHAYRDASASLLFFEGALYDTGYIYPPTFAFLFQPLAAPVARVSAALWYALNVAMLAGSLWMAARLFGLRRGWAVLALFLIFRFANNTLRSGQVNILILFLVCLSGLLVYRARERWAGLPLALATVIKVQPGLLLVFHLLQRRWALVAVGGAAVLLLLVLPGTALGLDGAVGLLVDWQAYAFSPYLVPGAPTPFEDPETGYIPGHSIRATIHRLVRPIDASPHDDLNLKVNILSLSRGAAEGITISITVLLAGLFVWSLRGGGGKGRFPMEYALAILFIFVLSPYVRKGHGTLLLIPYSAAIAAWIDPARSASFRRWTGIAIGASFVLCSLSGRFLLGIPGAAIASSLSAFLWGVLILLAWALVAIRLEGKEERTGRARSSGPGEVRRGP